MNNKLKAGLFACGICAGAGLFILAAFWTMWVVYAGLGALVFFTIYYLVWLELEDDR